MIIMIDNVGIAMPLAPPMMGMVYTIPTIELVMTGGCFFFFCEVYYFYTHIIHHNTT